MTSTPPRRPSPPAAARPREAVGFARKRPGPLYGVKAVGSFLPGLTRKAFEKYGFSAASSGHRLGHHRRPRSSPPTRRRSAEVAARRRAVRRGEAGKGRPGATLVLRVDGGRSLDVQHNARQIIERINAYFGYAAVAELRIVQAPVGADDRFARPRPVRQAGR